MRFLATSGPRRALTVVFFAHGALVSSWASRIPAVRDGLHMTNGQLGVALTGGTVGGIASLFVAAWLVARLGTSRVLWFAFAPAALALPGIALAGSAWGLAIALGLYGFLLGIVDIAMNAKGLALEHLRGTPLLSGLHAGWSGGNVVGAIGGVAAAHFGVGVGIHYVAAALLFIVVAMPNFGALAVLSPPPQPRKRLSLPPIALLPLAVLAFCCQFGEAAGFDWSAVLLADGNSKSAGAAGFAVLTGAMTITRAVGDRLARRLGSVRLVATGGAVSAVGMATALAASSPVLSGAGLALMGAGLATLVPVIYRAAGSQDGIAPASGIAMLSTVGYMSFVIAPPVIGLLSDHIGIRSALWIVVGVLALVVPLSPAARLGRSGKVVIADGTGND